MVNVGIDFVIYILIYNFSFLNNNSFSKGLNSRNCLKSNEKSVMITHSKIKTNKQSKNTKNHKQTNKNTWVYAYHKRPESALKWSFIHFYI